jgi:hypothetical protein
MSHTTSPKKPQSAYFIFSKEKRPEYKQKFPSLSAQDITKELARAFKELAPTDRKSWDEKSAKEKEEYEKVLQAHIHSPRKHKSKSDLSDDSKKNKTITYHDPAPKPRKGKPSSDQKPRLGPRCHDFRNKTPRDQADRTWPLAEKTFQREEISLHDPEIRNKEEQSRKDA